MNSLTKTPLELLPVGIIGNILDQLNQVTENDGIVNKAGIPVIMRYVGHLICTSKTMANNVNDPIATDLFLKSLSKKYEESCEHFAVLSNTIGARKWLWEYIKRKGDDKVYQAIQDVYELAAQVLQEAKEAGLDFECSEGRKDWPTPNPFYYQTKQGFVLYSDNSPRHLATPFGEIKICGNNCQPLDGKDLSSGIELWIDEKRKLCNLDSLKNAYDIVLTSISQNWVRSKLRDYPAILCTKSEEDYVLFVKKQEITSNEDVLIRLLANPLGLSKSIYCQRDWKNKTSSDIYLWVKKNGLEKTLAALNIRPS